jgi:serine/threonine protein kinase/Flp pilus assembly protein TadD
MRDEDGCSSLESIVARIADEFTTERKRGARPDPSAYARRYPEFAHIIRQVLSSLDLADLSSWSEAELTDQPAVATPPRHLGDFRIVREIGRGGMGIVYEAVQLSLNRRVALKVLPFAAALDRRHLERFRNEAQSAAQLHHSNIVSVFAVGCERGVHFYAMQFIDGQTLAQVIKEMRAATGSDHSEDANPSSEPISLDVVKPPPASDVTETVPLAALSTERSDGRSEFFRTFAKVGMRLAEALDYAHRQGVIHRDIKPANILLDAQGDVWITDFGLARLKNENGLTVSGDLLGTLRYMSPEQTTASRTPVDHRSDIYSLGATLYELVSLRPVFASQDRAVLLRQITSEEPCLLRRLDRAVPVELEIIVAKALAKEPRARYATAQELADDLRRFLDHKPIRARRPSLWEKARKWAYRHRPAVWSAIIAFMVPLMVLGGSIGWAIRDRAIWFDRASAEERADYALAATLESIRVSNADAEADDRFGSLPKRLPDYLRALSDHGWAPAALTPQEAANRLRRRPRAVRDTILGSLDHVLILARFRQAPEAGWLQAVVDRADNDPWRQALRAARRRQDRAAIIRLAAEVDVRAQPRETLFVLELGLFQRAAYDAALNLLRRAQEAYPDDFWINYDLGTTLRWYRPAECHEAIRCLTVATALRPMHARARVWLGNGFAANNQLDEAEGAFRKAIELDPRNARAHYELGLALAAKGRLADGIAAFEQALSLTSEPPTPEGVHIDPVRAVIYCDLGIALLRGGRVEEAIITVQKAIDLKPNFARPRWLYSFALLRSGRFADAATALCQAVSAEIRARTAEVQARTERRIPRRDLIPVE